MGNFGPAPRPVGERFWTKVAMTGNVCECWEWLASTKGNGYGQFYVDSRVMQPAHRVSYALTLGQIPDGLELDHLCRNRSCVNPWHLEPVTQSENSKRSPLIGRWDRRARYGQAS